MALRGKKNLVLNSLKNLKQSNLVVLLTLHKLNQYLSQHNYNQYLSQHNYNQYLSQHNYNQYLSQHNYNQYLSQHNYNLFITKNYKFRPVSGHPHVHKWSLTHTEEVSLNMFVHNRVSNIIIRYTNHTKFAACMAVWFITFCHALLVPFFNIAYMVVCFVCFCLIL